MLFWENSELRVRYTAEGDPSRPALILSNSLGTTLDMWLPQAPIWAKEFFVIRHDTRGHGYSSVPSGPYTIAQMADDVLHLLDALEIRRSHFCGLSMGGMVGQWLGAHHPERIKSLVLCNTAAKVGNADGWDNRIAAVRDRGMKAIVPGVLERWFTETFRRRNYAVVRDMATMLEHCRPAGYIASCEAVRDMDLRTETSSIGCRTLVIGGVHDLVTTMDEARNIAVAVPGAELIALDAAHLSNLEAPAEFTTAVLDFLRKGEKEW